MTVKAMVGRENYYSIASYNYISFYEKIDLSKFRFFDEDGMVAEVTLFALVLTSAFQFPPGGCNILRAYLTISFLFTPKGLLKH